MVIKNYIVILFLLFCFVPHHVVYAAAGEKVASSERTREQLLEHAGDLLRRGEYEQAKDILRGTVLDAVVSIIDLILVNSDPVWVGRYRTQVSLEQALAHAVDGGMLQAYVYLRSGQVEKIIEWHTAMQDELAELEEQGRPDFDPEE